ncbi:DsbA family protein [Fodinibius halophilus]|uniref:Thioredoxin domain-containing protein n=1 Tax=Fodinibius halophilus TaxID=1736908 RepID=A0A6M1T3F3_9BACT|nr:thioredoxin domain-containing protein [Fodinibius halophilus]NGP88599.1 thioredoxin domain-containing protein [Fodinibius halophilus]
MKKVISICFVIFVMSLGMGTAQAQSDSSEVTKITITEFSDYQCPACASYHPFVKKLKKELGDQIELKLKHYPLNMHQFAALAARAAESAGNQDKFYEMHNMLYENQQHWSNSVNPAPIFENYAKKLGLDMKEFRNDLNAAETQKAVMEEKKEGRKMGVNSTPTFFIEGEKLDPLPRSYNAFKKVVEKYLAKKKG